MEPSTYAIYLERTKPIALPKFMMYQSIHEQLIQIVKNITSRYGIESVKQHAYMWYVQGLWYISNRYKSKAKQIECDALFVYWYLLGLKEDVLRQLAKALGIKISSWEEISKRIPVVAPPLTEEIIYRGTKRALAETLERVETDLTDIEITYDAENRPIEIIKTDKVTGKKKKITLKYDAVGNLIEKTEEWL